MNPLKKHIFNIAGHLAIGICGILFFLAACSESASDGGFYSGSGKGGSLARFTIAGNNLYTIDQSNMQVFDISDPEKPEYKVNKSVGWDVETIFPYNDETLFLGTMSGMYIYDVSNPLSPKQISFYQHIVSCDPVVAEGSYAYVTLRTGSSCRGGGNLLQIVDISNLASPYQVFETQMDNPKGLGIDGNLLFVSDAGIKVFDVSNPLSPKLIHHEFNILANDVIPFQDVLIITADNGIFQYQYANNDFTELSSINISQ